MPTDPKRGRGRPRTRPDGAKRRNWWATDAEFAEVTRRAESAGVSAEEYVRRRALFAGRGRTHSDPS